MWTWKITFQGCFPGNSHLSHSPGDPKLFWPRHSQSLVRGPDKKPSCSNNDFFNIQTLLIQIGLSLWSKKRYILNLEALKELQLFNWFIMSFNHVSYIPLPWFLITAFKCFNCVACWKFRFYYLKDDVYENWNTVFPLISAPGAYWILKLLSAALIRGRR